MHLTDTISSKQYHCATFKMHLIEQQRQPTKGGQKKKRKKKEEEEKPPNRGLSN